MLFVLLGQVAYEGEVLLGVYSSQVSAEAARDEFVDSQEYDPYDSYTVHSVGLDTAAESHY